MNRNIKQSSPDGIALVCLPDVWSTPGGAADLPRHFHPSLDDCVLDIARKLARHDNEGLGIICPELADAASAWAPHGGRCAILTQTDAYRDHLRGLLAADSESVEGRKEPATVDVHSIKSLPPEGVVAPILITPHRRTSQAPLSDAGNKLVVEFRDPAEVAALRQFPRNVSKRSRESSSRPQLEGAYIPLSLEEIQLIMSAHLHGGMNLSRRGERILAGLRAKGIIQ